MRFYLVPALVLVAFLVGCKKDNPAPQTTVTVNNTTTTHGQPILTYVLQVVDAAGNAEGRVAGVQGGIIKYRNATGAAKTATTDASGTIVITDAAPGSFSARFERSGYASYDFTTDASPANAGLADSGKQYSASTRLYAIRANATLFGHVYGNYTGAPGTSIDPAAAANQASVTLKVTYNFVKTGNNAFPLGAGIGRITDINLDPSTVVIVTEDNGDFAQTGLPATKSGALEATLSMSPYLPDQSFSTGFLLTQSNNKIALTLGSAESTYLGNLLAARP